MRLPIVFMLACAALLPACASSGSQRSGAATPRAAGGGQAGNEDLPMPSKLVHDPKEVPAAVRKIETQIDRKGAILADDVLIEVSKNYQFEVSLAGDRIGHVVDGPEGTDRVALGPAIAYVRNLKIKADKRIRLRIAPFGTEPFIRITARGRCSHVVADQGPPRVERWDGLLIRNADIRYLTRNEIVAQAAEFRLAGD